jgi:aspartate-semialdehyde dehydrogenase
MPEKILKIALVGAASLLGKALNDELANSAFASADLRLLDEEDEEGKLAATADEATFIQTVGPDSFHGCDFTFFAGSAEQTQKHWHQALKAGSRIVDLSGALEGAPGAIVRAPWVQEDSLLVSASASQTQESRPAPDLQTRTVVSAHPVAVLLALLVARSQQLAPVRRTWATLLQPASEYGHEALEELHRQTANLLSFQAMPTEIFGGQTAFNLAVSFGAEGRVLLTRASDTIRRQYAQIAPALADTLALQIIQVPVFHGYALSIALEFAEPVGNEAAANALAGPHVRIIAQPSEFPGNVQAVEEKDVQILVQPVNAGSQSSGESKNSRFWLWVVADNLKFAAQNAIACAAELNRLRPRGSVQ